MNNKIQIVTITVALMMVASLALAGSVGSGFATKDAYKSGYDHGCDDAQISNPSDWYINGVNSNGESTGPDHHTTQFMAGYNAGFKECGYDNGVLIDNSNTDVNTQNQAAETNQGVSCHVLIGNCNSGQTSSNKFAAAND